MSDAIVYVDHSKIHDGAFAELEAGIAQLVQFIDDHEPQLMSYGFFFDAARARMTVIAVHPDSASLELHLDVGGPEFRKLAHLIELERIEIYGNPSDAVMAQLRQKASMLGEHAEVVVHERSAGFTR